MPHEPGQHGLSREVILEALANLNDRLAEEGVIGEICIYGGSAMVLAFNARLSTKDVDAIFKPAEIIRRVAADVAQEMELPEDWLNDSVKGFASAAAEHTSEGLTQWPHLRVIRPTVEYLLAMKCLASRAAGYDSKGDQEDIAFLIRKAGLNTPEEALAIVEKFYPASRILPKTHFMLLEVFEGLSQGRWLFAGMITHLSSSTSSCGDTEQ